MVPQAALPIGATLLGMILSSDKTLISSMTGNRVAHPLQISLANLDMEYRNKVSNKAFMLLALIPVPQFLHPTQRICGMLEARLFHEIMDFILHPLKIAATIGIMLNDPTGYRRYCYTPIASCIVDTPEAALYAGVAGLTSPITMASYKEFGDPFCHEPRHATTTLKHLQLVERGVDPWNLQAYLRAAMSYRLSGVHRPFWHNWPLSVRVTYCSQCDITVTLKLM